MYTLYTMGKIIIGFIIISMITISKELFKQQTYITSAGFQEGTVRKHKSLNTKTLKY